MSNIGYKGLTIVENGAFYAPYVPKDLTNMSYIDTLSAIKATHSMLRKYEDLETYATTELQRKFSGNYRIEEYYDGASGKFKLRMVFDSEADEIDFVLKYK